MLSILVLVNLNFSTTIAKTLTSDSYYSQQSSQSAGTPHQQQQEPHQHNIPVNYGQYTQQQQNPYPQSPSYPEYDENMESYEYPSSEEIMPVKNSQFVPVEDGNATATEGGHIPQRQVSLSQFWQNHMQEQQNNPPNTQFQGVTDEENIEVVSIPGSNNYNQTNNNGDYAGGSLSQFYQHQQQSQGHIYQPQEIEPTQTASPPISITSTDSSPVVVPVRKKSDVSKLVVETRRTAEGKKIAVVRDRMRAARQKRSLMTLSREDENDSEYDDLDSAEKAKNKNTQTKSNSTVKATVKS